MVQSLLLGWNNWDLFSRLVINVLAFMDIFSDDVGSFREQRSFEVFENSIIVFHAKPFIFLIVKLDEKLSRVDGRVDRVPFYKVLE